MLKPSDFIFNEELQSERFVQYFESHTPVAQMPEDCDNPYIFRSSFSPQKFDHNITYTYKDSYRSYSNKIDAPIDPKDYFHFLSKFLEKNSIRLDSIADNVFLPGVRFYNDSIVVFERPPMQVPFTFSLDYRDNVVEDTATLSYYIPIPWQVYVCQYNPKNYRLIDVAMYFSKSSLYSLEQEVYAPPLFNFYSNGNLCRPFFASSDDVEKYPQNVFGVTAAAYDWVWNSNFNFDITDNIIEFLYNKRFHQFERYITTEEDRAYYDFLLRRPLFGFTRMIDHSYYKALFSLWSIVPVEEISFIDFAPYSKNEFFYQDINNHNVSYSYDLAVDYCELNDLIFHDREFGHTCHCEDCCPEECLSYDDLTNDSDFLDHCERINPKEEPVAYPSTISNAISIRYESLRAANIGIIPPAKAQLTNKFNEAYYVLSS